MDPIYEQLIEREKRKLDALKNRVLKIEQRIETLIEMAREDDGEAPVPALTPRHALQANGIVPKTQSLSSESGDSAVPRRRVSPRSLTLLRYIGLSGRSLDELEAFSSDNGLSLNRDALRSFANLYRRRYSLLETERPGFYKLTELGQQYVNDNQLTVPAIDSRQTFLDHPVPGVPILRQDEDDDKL